MRGGETDVGAASIVWIAQVREPRLPVRMHQLDTVNIKYYRMIYDCQ